MLKLRGTGTSEIPAIDLATPLAVADGGSGVSVTRGLAQIVTFQTGTVATGTTQIPGDDTIPQITEGTEFMTLAITPTNASSTLEIEINFMAGVNASVDTTVALFQDSTANALAAMLQYVPTGRMLASFEHVMIAGTTSATTFRVRCGGGASSTISFNGSVGSRVLGGVMASRITIKEYLP